MGAQQTRLDKLLPPEAQQLTPPAIDPTVWAAIVPLDNAMTPERIALGRKLYFDTRLSADGTVACATCHDVSRGFTDQRPVSEGIRDQLGRRNAPTNLNALLAQFLFLDGRAPSLEAQAKLPIVNPIEMGQPNGDSAVRAIAADPAYQQLFQQAYGRAPNYDDVGRALAAFERTLVFLDSPFDQFLRGKSDAISAQAQQGSYLDGGTEPLALSEAEIDALVAWMSTLTDSRFAEQGRAELERQRALAKKQRPFRDTALAMRQVLPFEARVMQEGKER